MLSLQKESSPTLWVAVAGYTQGWGGLGITLKA